MVREVLKKCMKSTNMQRIIGINYAYDTTSPAAQYLTVQPGNPTNVVADFYPGRFLSLLKPLPDFCSERIRAQT